MNDIIFRKATTKDIPFLIDTIIESEKSGTNKLSYVSIFGLSMDEVRKYLNEMLLEEVDDCAELSISNFLIAEKNGEVVGSIAGWVESEGFSSAIYKGNLLKTVLPKEAIDRAMKIQKLIHELQFDFIPNTFFMKTMYVPDKFRGNNMGQVLKEKMMEKLSESRPDVKEVYVDTFTTSLASLKSTDRLGFEIVEIKESSNDEILKYLPSKIKILRKKVLK